MNENELKALVSLLDDEDHEVTSHVESKIISLGSQVIPFLENEWENSFNPNVQRKIENLIHNLQFDATGTRLKKWKDEDQEDILKAMWIIATYIYPDLDLKEIQQELEQLYYEVWLEFKYEMQPFDQIKIFNSIFFGKLKFRANTQNFHSPSNSMINKVIETKKGNPISLCIIYMLIAQKLKLPVYGVNLPNLFILTYKNEQLQFYINTFNRGLIFTKGDVDNYIAQLQLQPSNSFYEPCTHLDIVKRVLRNLVVAFQRQGEHDKVGDLERLLSILEA